MGVPEETIQLIKSFLQDMKAKIRLKGKTVGEIKVQIGLRQGCCMAPVLFNLYTSLAVERWLERLEGDEGVGITFKHKVDGNLFRCYTRNAQKRKITECQFADESALLASTRAGAEKTALTYQQTNSDFGLTVSIPKTKHMVTGRLVKGEDRKPIDLEGGENETVEEFQ